jgi:type I restriction enzyme S subunit
MAKLGDICTIVSGTTPRSNVPEYWDGDINWVTPAELNDNSEIIYKSQRQITEQAVQESSLKPFPAGTVLLSSRAPIGKVAIAGVEMYCNQGFKNLICSNQIHNKYLYWFLKGKTDYLNSLGRGATFKEISKSIVEDIEIPLPPLDKQRKIAAVLDKVSDLIALRKQQLEKLDELVKTRFVEMFGDYHTNSKNFELHKGSELFKFSSGKFLPEEKRLKDGTPVYGGNGIAWYTDEFLIDYPSIIIGRVGAWCGNVHTVVEPVWITDNAIYIKEQKTDKFTLEFLSEMMRIMDFHQYADFSGQPKITQKPLETLEYLTPPIEMQNEFTAFCKQVDKSKLFVQKSLDQLETLKKALMQKCFG